MKWEIVYKRAIGKDGNLFFPERLSEEFLKEKRVEMGSYAFANQYMNDIIPQDQQVFKKQWIKHWNLLPDEVNTFVFIDPAISLEKNSDYTACVVVDVDQSGAWYVRQAQRYKITPSEIINLIFRVNSEFKPRVIGIEDVAYQRALLYMLNEQMQRTGVIIPVTGVKPDTTKHKNTRIRELVPRFEWNKLFLAKGLSDLEDELSMFPRGAHDDLLDALAYIKEIYFIPEARRPTNEKPHPSSGEYESWYIQQLQKRSNKNADE